MYYIPSPIRLVYDSIYTAKANESGRMQYYKKPLGQKRERISRGEFIKAYNEFPIIAMRPIPNQQPSGLFEIEFFTSKKSL